MTKKGAVRKERTPYRNATETAKKKSTERKRGPESALETVQEKREEVKRKKRTTSPKSF